MAHKNLALNADMIPQELKAFCGGEISIVPHGVAKHYSFTKDGNQCCVVAYTKNNGTVTLDSNGKNGDVAEQAIQHLVQRLTLGNKPFVVSLENFTQEKFEELLAYLKEDVGATVSDKDSGRENAKAYYVAGKNGDAITITLYDTGTLLFQGRPLLLATSIVEYISDDASVSHEAVLKCAGEVFGSVADPKTATTELDAKYPNAAQLAGPRLKSMLLTAIGMRGVPLVMQDYSVIPFPALKALEGFMKQSVLRECNEEWSDFKDKFDLAPPLKYKLKTGVESALGCPVTSAMLNECYSHYCAHRHGTFHAQAEDAATRIIPNRLQAMGILDTALDMIERHSKAFVEKQNEALHDS